MPDPPLTDRELRVLRGMIDEYQYRMVRRRMFAGAASDFKTIVAIAGALTLIALNVVTVVLLLRSGKP